MPNSFSSTRVSSIYWDVLRRQVNRYCPSLYPRAEGISSNYSAERLVHIKQPMLVGINSIRQSLNRIGIKLPEDIADIIMYSETPCKTCEKFRKQIARKGITCEEKGDILLLCSDGLSNYVDDLEMFKILSKHSSGEAADKLIDTANAHGGGDNVTAVTICC